MPDFVFNLAPTYEVGIGITDVPQPNVAFVLDEFMRGPPGLAGNAGQQIEQTASTGANTIVVGVPFNLTIHKLFINGLAQSRSAYSVTSTQANLPTTLNCIAGDVLTFEYIPL